MSPSPGTTPTPEPPTELAREIARRRSARRRVPMAIAVAAVVVGGAATAGTEARAATPDLGYATAGGGHSAHAGRAATAASSSSDDAPNFRRSNVQDANSQDANSQDSNGQEASGQEASGQEASGQDANGQDANREDANREDANREDANREDANGRDANGRDANRQDANGQNNNGQNNNGQNNNGQNNGGQADRGDTNGLDVLAQDCGASKLPEHTGFQVAPACVDTAFGEVAAADEGPSLLIAEAPSEARVGESFTLKVSTRNLVRDRFLGAAAGGYYLESSLLTSGGLQRGHFHTACRMLASTNVAPESGPSPAFFVATQDNGGGAEPDTVTINVNGMPSAGVAQCTSWAGDGSHRVPMMQRADQTPAIDSVRINVK